MKIISFKKFFIFFLLIIILCSSVLLYSHFIGVKGLNVKEYKISYSKLNDDFYGLKIVHFSDLFYGKTINSNELKKIVNQINLTKPDLVVFTGDLINPNIKLNEKEKINIIELLSNIDSNIGKYQIKGEQDINNKHYDEIMNNSGFIDLNDSYDLIYTNSNNYISLIGMSSNYKENSKEIINEKINNSINTINNEEIKSSYTILIMHEPDFIDKIDISPYNLILAGHSLNGQVRLPFIGAIMKNKYGTKYSNSYYKKNKTDIYISGGLGVKDNEFRLFNHPSFNLYRLTK